MFKNNIVTPGYPPFQKDGPFWHLVKGDPEKGFEECAYIAEDTVEFSKMAAPPSALAALRQALSGCLAEKTDID